VFISGLSFHKWRFLVDKEEGVTLRYSKCCAVGLVKAFRLPLIAAAGLLLLS